MEVNLWPDFSRSDLPPTPKSIIEDAGEGLKEKTDSLVRFYIAGVSFSEGFANVRCTLYASKLLYHYPFLTAKFPMVKHYPVELTVDKLEQTIVANDQPQLLQALEKVFNMPSTVETISQLIGLSK
jgi:hypothetical protein